MTLPELPQVNEMVDVCVELAEQHFEEGTFDEGDYFVDVTMWSDEDYRIEVRHGMEYSQNPYSQDVEMVIYDHEPRRASYTALTRYPNLTRFEDIHKLKTFPVEEVFDSDG